MGTMLSDWTYWLSSMPQDELWLLLLPVLMLDGLRYVGLTFLCWIYDGIFDLKHGIFGGADRNNQQPKTPFCPTVSVIIAGLNEGDSVYGTLDRLWGSYPRLQLIVVDDGSSDNMASEAHRFAAHHPGVLVVSKRRGGKSSALNTGLAMATGEICITVDADSELTENSIWAIIEPLSDPKIGAVAGNVRVRNAHVNLLTQLQAFEYLRSISLGRRVLARLGLLGIVSGAFGAFRTNLLKDMGGWDVGPGEDEDLVLRIRKLGYQIAFAPQAYCLTDSPHRWRVLTKQRRRWEWAVVTFESRKHIDMANPFLRHFRLSNFFLFTERWLYNLLLPLWCWIYLFFWVWSHGIDQLVYPMFLYYLLYALGDLIQYLLILYYSQHFWSDAKSIVVIPWMPFYQAYQRIVTSVAIIEEMLSRRSFRDGFVPEHVRRVTWHW